MSKTEAIIIDLIRLILVGFAAFALTKACSLIGPAPAVQTINK